MLTAFGAFHVPPTILVGGGVRREVVAQLQKYLIQRVLLVTDVGMMQLGPAREIAALLDDAGVSVTIYDGVQPDPTDQNVAHGLDLFRSNDCQAIVAVGGGSPIDAAKAISVLTTNSSPLSQYAGYHKIPRAGAPLIAIPTTAGTGSEATKVAVITDTTQDVKSMILSVHLVPTAALVDYELTLSMPPDLTAAVGVDTLTHGIEAYVSRKANGMTDPLALSCIELVAKHLRKAYREPNNHDARAGMMLAACQGGMAFANSSVCLVHGMSRPIGAIFHVPHGLSNAVLLPTVTQFSWRASITRYATVARLLNCCPFHTPDEPAAESLVKGLQQLNTDLNVPRLRDCRGVDEARFRSLLSKMAADALTSGSPQNNPRVPTAEEIVALYESAWSLGG
ncbi:MAG: iron-containing alcohol dehydrogenase [Planctomycetes bacterium]|nr:iron-containing alcohol dehydrogenase [Planctomycetota bacterium]